LESEDLAKSEFNKEPYLKQYDGSRESGLRLEKPLTALAESSHGEFSKSRGRGIGLLAVGIIKIVRPHAQGGDERAGLVKKPSLLLRSGGLSESSRYSLILLVRRSNPLRKKDCATEHQTDGHVCGGVKHGSGKK